MAYILDSRMRLILRWNKKHFKFLLDDFKTGSKKLESISKFYI